MPSILSTTAVLLAGAQLSGAFLQAPVRVARVNVFAETSAETDAATDVDDMSLEQMFEVFEEADQVIPDAVPMASSEALPWLPRPAGLNSVKIAGDFGFDPIGLGSSKEAILKYRAAEIKHCRLAMLAAAGWPVAELYDGGLANLIGASSPIAENGGLSPSLLNGGLGLVSPIYWAVVVLAAVGVEVTGMSNKAETPGDYGFDPIGLYPDSPNEQMRMQDQELTHGRTAMIAIVAFAAQEFTSKVPVTRETPFLFEPIWTYLTKDLGGFDLSRGFIEY